MELFMSKVFQILNIFLQFFIVIDAKLNLIFVWLTLASANTCKLLTLFNDNVSMSIWIYICIKQKYLK